jgi:dTDP-4-dehydrorhamnose reductase
MRILLTGATGQLGKTILDQFSNFDIYAPTHESLDLTSHESVSRAVTAFGPDVIINAAAWTDVPRAELCPEETFQINLCAVENLAYIGANLGAKFIQISTDYVFDGNSAEPYKENFVKNPLSVYGLSKSQAEEYLLNEHLEHAYIIRTSWLYSKYGRNFVKSILNKLISDDREIEVVDDQFGSPTLANDLASALELFCKNDYKPGLYHFANTGIASWYSFAQTIAEYSNLKPERIVSIQSKVFENLVRRPSFSVLNTNKYTLMTGKTPPSWHESLLGELPRIRAEVEREPAK